jgi:hypothetical protein
LFDASIREKTALRLSGLIAGAAEVYREKQEHFGCARRFSP